jgi:hypothetical protein
LKLTTLPQRCELFEELIAIYHGCNAHLQVEALRAIPHQSKSNKILRKWLAWGMLVDLPDPLEVVRTPVRHSSNSRTSPCDSSLTRCPSQAIFAAPPRLEGIPSILELPRNGPFKILPDMDDSALYHHVMILSIALTDLSDEMYAGVGEDGRDARACVEDIHNALKMIDSRIRPSLSIFRSFRSSWLMPS